MASINQGGQLRLDSVDDSVATASVEAEVSPKKFVHPRRMMELLACPPEECDSIPNIRESPIGKAGAKKDYLSAIARAAAAKAALRPTPGSLILTAPVFLVETPVESPKASRRSSTTTLSYDFSVPSWPAPPHLKREVIPRSVSEKKGVISYSFESVVVGDQASLEVPTDFVTPEAVTLPEAEPTVAISEAEPNVAPEPLKVDLEEVKIIVEERKFAAPPVEEAVVAEGEFASIQSDDDVLVPPMELFRESRRPSLTSSVSGESIRVTTNTRVFSLGSDRDASSIASGRSGGGNKVFIPPSAKEGRGYVKPSERRPSAPKIPTLALRRSSVSSMGSARSSASSMRSSQMRQTLTSGCEVEKVAPIIIVPVPGATIIAQPIPSYVDPPGLRLFARDSRWMLSFSLVNVLACLVAEVLMATAWTELSSLFVVIRAVVYFPLSVCAIVLLYRLIVSKPPPPSRNDYDTEIVFAPPPFLRGSLKRSTSNNSLV